MSQPTEWCSPTMVVPKANGNARIYVNLTEINQAVLREIYHMPTVEETLGNLQKDLYSPSSMQIQSFAR